MKVERFSSEDKVLENKNWLEARKGKITGTRLKDIVVKRGTAKKIAFYELIAERLAVSEEDCEGYVPNETPMARGTRMQEHAIRAFERETAKKVDQTIVLWMREDNDSIAISPDGVISKTEAVETKCLSSSRHVEAYLTQAVPEEYEFQALQYFIVNDQLKTLHFVFYDPRLPAIQYFSLKLHRENLLDDINTYLAYQLKELAEIELIVSKLTF
jgi:predicted phage-related endonuclease